jgi:hypothetical protein
LAALPALAPRPARANETPHLRKPPDELLGEWPAPRLHGQGQMRFFGLHVYDIRLWTPQPRISADDWWRQPLALEIEYGRALVGRLIAERSLQEMRRSGPLGDEAAQRWLGALTRLFPDVKAGDRLTGVLQPEGVVRVFAQGSLRGEVRDAEFARRFFAIWLGPETSEPGLRDSLLGRR